MYTNMSIHLLAKTETKYINMAKMRLDIWDTKEQFSNIKPQNQTPLFIGISLWG